MSTIILSDIVPLRERGTWQAVINLIFATGASAGAPLGGIIADSIGWRWYGVPASFDRSIFAG